LAILANSWAFQLKEDHTVWLKIICLLPGSQISAGWDMFQVSPITIR